MRTQTYLTLRLLGLLCLLVGANASAATTATDAPLQQHWIKRGILFAPGFAGPQSAKFVSAPSVIKLPDGRLRMYVWVADDVPPWLRGNHIIIAAESNPANPFEWKVISQEPLVGPDPGSAIRNHGVGFPYVLPRDDGPWLMYYGTWGGDWTIKQELLNRLGLAVSHDAGLTWEVAVEDSLPSGPPGSFDAGAIPSAAVLREGKNEYRMWYTTAEKYLRFGDVNQGIMHLGTARSTDGIHWQKSPEPAFRAREDAADPYEACLARPFVLKQDGVYHMWFGVYDMAPGSQPNRKKGGLEGPVPGGKNRTGAGSYRIEYARSSDGENWVRYVDQPIIPLTPGGFDSTSQTYVSVVDMGDQLWMFYTGDGLGATGVGLATLQKSELKAR
jgi:hypothetical protein